MSALHKKNALKLATACRKNGATWVKLAQILSCRPDILPKEYIDALKILQNDAAPVKFDELIPVLEQEFGLQWKKKFRSIEPIPIATASIAQVHKAVLMDGREVAIKIQLPGVAKLFDQDFVIFLTLAEVIARFITQVDVKQIANQLLKTTQEELSFIKEAENIQLFSQFKHLERIKSPVLVEALSSDTILVTEWVDGLRLREYLDKHPDQARELLALLLNSYIQQITKFGVFHGDPHPGNFIINDKGEITILDFGVVGTLTQEETTHYSALLFTLLDRSTESLNDVFARAGFEGIQEDTFKDLTRIFLGSKNFSTEYTELLSESLEILRKQHITVPDSFVALARALVTVGGFMQTYDVHVKESIVTD